MKSDNEFVFTNRVVFIPFLFILTIWSVFWFELSQGVNLNDLGIYPRAFSGLKGIVLSPFIHGSLGHLYNNTIPLAILLAALCYFYKDVAYPVILWGIFLSGAITWVIGRPSFHIGASGLIYVLASFIFFKGIFTKHYRLVALSLVVVFIYGGLLWYIFPIKDDISWEGHLGGFAAGLLLAVLLNTKITKKPKYTWEQEDYNEAEDLFLRHFDENGNFREIIPEEELENKETDKGYTVKYWYKQENGNNQ